MDAGGGEWTGTPGTSVLVEELLAPSLPQEGMTGPGFSGNDRFGSVTDIFGDLAKEEWLPDLAEADDSDESGESGKSGAGGVKRAAGFRRPGIPAPGPMAPHRERGRSLSQFLLVEPCTSFMNSARDRGSSRMTPMSELVIVREFCF